MIDLLQSLADMDITFQALKVSFFIFLTICLLLLLVVVCYIEDIVWNEILVRKLISEGM